MLLETRIKLIKLASIGTGAFGIMAVVSLLPGAEPLMATFFDFAVGAPLDGLPVITAPETRLLIAIMGGLMAGLGVFTWMLAEHIYRYDPKLAQRMLIVAFMVWYVVDSLGSAVAGSWQNVLMNTGFLAMFMIPALWPEKKAEALA